VIEPTSLNAGPGASAPVRIIAYRPLAWEHTFVRGEGTILHADLDAFYAAVDEIARVAGGLLDSLESTATPKNREEEAAKAKERAAQRFGG